VQEKRTAVNILSACLLISRATSDYGIIEVIDSDCNIFHACWIVTSTKEVMFSPVSFCLSVNRITQKLLMRSL